MDKNYKNLIIWQKGDEIFDMVCEDIKQWPNDAIVNSIKYQLLDSAGSISANIAEGYGRGSPKEFEQFLRISRGSAAEADNWLSKAAKRKFISNARLQSYERLFSELRLMTASFINQLRRQSKRNPLKAAIKL